MKSIGLKGIASLIAVLLFGSCSQKTDSRFGQGPYLGQTPPSDVPKLFAPGIVANFYVEHSACLFTPDGLEVFWTRQIRPLTLKNSERTRLVITMHMKQKKGIWTEPELASFNQGLWTFVTGISPDGNRLYFDSIRPHTQGGEPQGGVWMVERTPSGWSEPRLFTALNHWGHTVLKVQESRSGNLYFQATYPKPAVENKGWHTGLYVCKKVDGEYQEPVPLGPSINSPNYLDYGAFVDPDERYILFSSNRPGGYSSLDLYISYHLPDDTWSEAVNLGKKINTHGKDGSDWPCVSPDGKHLFFLTTLRPADDLDADHYTLDELTLSQMSATHPNSKIHWVRADFIDALKPDALK